MREVSDADKIFYFEKNFFTLDGLWMRETEKEVGLINALKIDNAVWTRLMRIIHRRIGKYLNIEANNLDDLIELLTFRWSIEKWKYQLNRISETEAIIDITECPYTSIMDRNPEQQSKIPLICKEMCIPIYNVIINEFNPKIEIERKKFMGLGDDICNFHFIQEINNSIHTRN